MGGAGGAWTAPGTSPTAGTAASDMRPPRPGRIRTSTVSRRYALRPEWSTGGRPVEVADELAGERCPTPRRNLDYGRSGPHCEVHGVARTRVDLSVVDLDRGVEDRSLQTRDRDPAHIAAERR